jgi:serine protease
MRPIAATLTSLSMAALVFASLCATSVSAAENNPARTRPKAEQQASAQRIIVKFRDGSGVSTQGTTGRESASSAPFNASRITSLASRGRFTLKGSRAISSSMHVLQIEPLTTNESATETLARLNADSDVEYAVLDRRVYAHSTTSNDPLAAGQWYLAAVQPAAINAQGAWDNTKGSNGVVVAVVDTGVRFDHPDLGRANSFGKLLPGYDFVSAETNGGFTTANDGDARDADPSDPGDNCAPDNSSWHGTRVSGIIGALTNNSAGVAGVMWNGYILPVRVLGRCGGFNSDVLAGIRWAAGLSVAGIPTNPYPARIINVSLGGEGTCDLASANVINEVATAGVLVVVSAGNEGGPVDSPANCPGAMGILGLRAAGTKVGFSSLGPEIALGAPGGNCINDTGACLFSIDTTTNNGATSPTTNGYTDQINFNVGTSFSSPIVSGIAGLMLSVNGNLRSSQLVARMRASALPFPTTNETGSAPAAGTCHLPVNAADIQGAECVCTTAACGAGMANANGAVAQALRPIAAISAPATVNAGSNVTLDASGSAAACNHTVATYAWTVTAGTASLSSNNTATTTLQAPATGTVVVHLVVTDEAGKTDAADIAITSTNTSTASPSTAGTRACLTAIVVPPAVTITATDSDVAEAATNPGTFMLTRSGDTTAALVVTIATTGTATGTTDYTALPTSVTIPAGAASANVTVTPVDDTTVETGGETVTVTVQAAAGYDVGTPGAATVTIVDNDTAAPPSNGGGGGGGGGGSLDLLTLVGLMGVVGYAVRRRVVVARGR